MIPFDYARPSSVQAAIEAVRKDPKAKFIAGGTNLVDLMKRGIMNPEKLIDISALPLSNMETFRPPNAKGNWLRIGSGVLNSTLSEHTLVTENWPLLAQALKAGASPQVRNMATAGGNLLQRTRCSYFYDPAFPCNKREPGTGCSALKGHNRMHAIFGTSEACIAVHPSDMAIALAALNAVVIANGPKGIRRIPISDFHRLPGNTPHIDNNLQRDELITAIEIPPAPGLVKNAIYTKVRDRASYAFALVSVALALEMDTNSRNIKDVRIALGGVAHRPWRLTKTEAMLIGQQPSERLFNNAILKGLEGAKTFGHNHFKVPMARNTILHSLKTATGLA